MKWIVPSVIMGVVVVGIVIVVFMKIGYTNQAIDYETQYEAQTDANKAIYDEVWKVLQQKAGVVSQYADDFKSVYQPLMEARYEGDAKGAPMFKWIQERNPTFSIDLYNSLSDAISAQRAKFTRVQLKLRDIKREHDKLRLSIPSSWFVGGRDELEVVLVTSAKTEQTFETGQENDVELFK